MVVGEESGDSSIVVGRQVGEERDGGGSGEIGTILKKIGTIQKKIGTIYMLYICVFACL